jgi:molybdopterin-containing oxidoreductase family iron-sulfur binding subunit
MSTERIYASRYWQSLRQRELTHDEAADEWREFEEGVDPAAAPPRDPGFVATTGLTRRKFFATAGAASALATSACVRKPVENILPFSERPEDLIPGKPMGYATAVQYGTTVEGLVVESQDGRPTKIEGNPKHPNSNGATSVWAQATVLDLYDPERTRVPLTSTDAELVPEGETHGIAEWGKTRDTLKKLFDRIAKSGGDGLGLVTRWIASPTQRAKIAELRARFPKARVFVDDALVPWNSIAAAETLAGKGARAYHVLDKTAVVFAADSDFLHTEPDSVRLQREWSKTRKIVGSTDFMSRLYVVEPALSNTGIMADHRRRVKGSAVGDVVIALLNALAADATNFVPPTGLDLSGLPKPKLAPAVQQFVDALASDLLASENKGRSAILVGERQPAWVHLLGFVIDAGLGNLKAGAMVEAERDPKSIGADRPTPGSGSLRLRFDSRVVEAETLADLSKALGGGEIKHLVCLETNPAYSGAGDLDLAKKLEAIGIADPKASKTTLVHVGLWRDETARLAHWHLPVSHFLEAWGDVEAFDGTLSIQQPLIEPLHDTYSVTELLGFFASGKMIDGYSLLKGFWTGEAAAQFSDRNWRQWLHDGMVTGVPRDPGAPAPNAWQQALGSIERKPIEGIELDLHVDPRVLDGRFVHNAWLQELPHPVSKVTWDNAAYVAPSTAAELGVVDGDLVTIGVEGRSITAAIWQVPGTADGVVSLAIGYGQTATPTATGAGVDVNPVRSSKYGWFAQASVAKAGDTYPIACTQDYGSMKPPSYVGFDFDERPIVLEKTRDEFKADPNFVEKVNLMERSRLQHLWDPPKLTGKQQWGMSIDLNTCVGCNACVIACQAENNIPTVGKEQVLRAREMHWMRIDRYFKGADPDDPTSVVVQPMLCQQCEAAPCETVCPVAATTHSPEGLNDMVYNRCIGTRYCSNNCPYKVRRFNYLAYNTKGRPQPFWNEDIDGAWLLQMQKNPDVTVRFRGVMEKCTYCVQRIQEKKIEAHVAGRDLVEDGKIQTACQQVCPSEAIVFGDIRDPDSKVSKAKRSPRDYQVLRDLNTHPRTTYLARIKNPNPALAKLEADAEAAKATKGA